MNSSTIIIRQLDPLPPGFDSPVKVYHVELYEGDSWPIGVAVVLEQREWLRQREREHPERRPLEDRVLRTALRISYLFVLDPWRLNGYGTELLKACLRRWPDIQYENVGATEAGEAFIESVGHLPR